MNSKHARKDSVCLCVVCCEDLELYAIGACDHPVCYKCCVRMRVLGKETYCPVCRTELKQVFLTDNKTSYEKLAAKKDLLVIDRRQGVFCQRKEIQANVKQLMEYRCPFCPDRAPERYFDHLRDHVKREHDKFYCDLCVTHLWKFSFELKAYSRPDLARHRRVGDKDDKSHKGHPLCEFCDQRYLDNDELHKHLRKDHFWCHFCERDGSQDYYSNYENLRIHFRDFHFLCEEDDCIKEKFTSVFRTKVDIQAHCAARHSGNLTKAQARQARQLEVDITFAPRPRPQLNQGAVITGRDYAEVRALEQRKGKKEKGPNRGGASTQNRSEKLDVQTAMALSLSREDPSRLPSPLSKPQEPKKYKPEEESSTGELLKYETDALSHFPSLLGSLEVTSIADKSKDNKRPNKSHQYDKALNKASLHLVEDFPTLAASAQMPEQSHSIRPGFAAVTRQPPSLAVPQQTYRAKPPPGFQASFTKAADEKVKENVAPILEFTAAKPQVKINNSAQERNQMLIEKIRGLLEYDKSKFDEFKALSGKFRKGACSATEYYMHCYDLFGTNFTQVFSELVDLLPDEEKQKELLSAHQDAKVNAKRLGSGKAKAGKANKKTPGVWQSEATAWNAGMQSNAISEMDFPSLPAAPKRSFQPSYRPAKSATVLKQAWIRGK